MFLRFFKETFQQRKRDVMCAVKEIVTSTTSFQKLKNALPNAVGCGYGCAEVTTATSMTPVKGRSYGDSGKQRLKPNTKKRTLDRSG